MNMLQEKDSSNMRERVSYLTKNSSSMTKEEIDKYNQDCQVIEDFELDASTVFSLHFEDATTLGFGYASHMITTKALPDAIKNIKLIEDEKKLFNESVSEEVINLCPRHWNWSDMSKVVGMEDEYDFLYSYSSKLLHAIPMSISTYPQNLNSKEIYMFLKHIDLRIKDVIKTISSSEYLKVYKSQQSPSVFMICLFLMIAVQSLDIIDKVAYYL